MYDNAVYRPQPVSELLRGRDSLKHQWRPTRFIKPSRDVDARCLFHDIKYGTQLASADIEYQYDACRLVSCDMPRSISRKETALKFPYQHTWNVLADELSIGQQTKPRI